MKHGKNPTRQQKEFLRKWKLNPSDWFVVKDTPDQLELVHRHFDSKTKILPKWRNTE